MDAIVYTTKGGSTMDAIKNIIIRLETKEDYRAVENLTRESFWNVYRPGCMEHYVLHCYRNDPAFVPELDFVMELGGELIGQVIYVRSEIECDDAKEICDYLLAGKAVVLNMEGIHTETAQRIIDFTSGSTYSMNGNLQKISNYIFIATPQSVELSGDFQDLLTGGNLDVSGLNIHL